MRGQIEIHDKNRQGRALHSSLIINLEIRQILVKCTYKLMNGLDLVIIGLLWKQDKSEKDEYYGGT